MAAAVVPAYFHVSFAPNLQLVPTVRRFSEEFYERMLVDSDLSARVALATHELLENAVKYASDGETRVRVELDAEWLTIRTWNRTTPEHFAELAAGIDELNAATDRDAYYLMKMEGTANRTDGSGLGLARICAEADMGVSYERTDDHVCITARAELRKEQRA